MARNGHSGLAFVSAVDERIVANHHVMGVTAFAPMEFGLNLDTCRADIFKGAVFDDAVIGFNQRATGTEVAIDVIS